MSKQMRKKRQNLQEELGMTYLNLTKEAMKMDEETEHTLDADLIFYYAFLAMVAVHWKILFNKD